MITKERPILFSAPMVRAILEGRKTMTRRPIKILRFGQITEFGKSNTPGYDWHFRDKRMSWNDMRHSEILALCPYGQPGQKLWVREAFATDLLRPEPRKAKGPCEWGNPIYRATFGAMLNPQCEGYSRWKPSIHMPRWASRITLEVTNIRLERLQAITEADAQAEGVESFPLQGYEPMPGDDRMTVWRDYQRKIQDDKAGCFTARNSFETLWESINGAGSWDANQWVWVLEFKPCVAAGKDGAQC